MQTLHVFGSGIGPQVMFNESNNVLDIATSTPERGGRGEGKKEGGEGD